jgi:hypothetical protein
VGGDVTDGYLVDIAVRFFSEISPVSLPRELVPIAGENALSSDLLERDAESSDTTEQIDEPERVGIEFSVLGRGGLALKAIRRGIFPKCRRVISYWGLLRDLGCSLLCWSKLLLPFRRHASTPSQSSAVVSPSALAILATFLMPGFLSPLSMPLI